MNQRFDVVQPVRVGECSQNKVSVGIRIGIILDWEESDLSGAQQSAFQHVNTAASPIFSFLKNTLNILKANQEDQQ